MATPLSRFLDKWTIPSPNQATAIRDLFKGTAGADAAAIKFTSRLVDLVVAIKALPDHVIGNETTMKWSKLPLFDSAMTENIFTRDVEFPNEKQLKENINKITFAANIAARQIPDVDYTVEAMYDMASAFEPPPESAEAVDKEAIRHLNATVPVSAQWMFHAGTMVYNAYECPHPKMDRGIWDGQPGFTKPRWDFWKARGAWVAELTKLPKETRAIAKKMVDAMEEIESAAE